MNITILHKRLLLIAIGLIMSNLSFSQGERKYITFSGYIVDSKTQEALPNATIHIANAGKGTIANAKGYFVINAFPGDSIIFSYVGFKKQYHKIPRNVELSYSAVIGLQQDAKMLKEVKVYPYSTEAEFKEALVAMKIPDEREREVLAQTFNTNNLNFLAATQGLGGGANYRNAMNLQQNSYSNIGNVTMNPLFNPFAWASFIKGIKNGSLKDKSWKNAAKIEPRQNVTREEFFRNGGAAPENH